MFHVSTLQEAASSILNQAKRHSSEADTANT